MAEVAGAGDGPKKVSLKKKVSAEDFGGPKKAPSGWMLFCDSVRPKIMADMKAAAAPGTSIKISDVAKKCAEQWTAIKNTEEEKKFAAKAVELKAKYDSDLLKWQATAQYKEYLKADQAHEKKKAVSGATKLAKESGMPKKPMAAYMLFNVEQTPGVIEEERAKNDGKAPDMTARAAIIKKKWDALGATGQKKYEDKYAADKAQYAIDLENWNKSEAGIKYKQALLDTDPKKALKEAGEPTRPMAAFMMFANAHLTEVANQNGGKRPAMKEGNALAKTKWDSMTAEEKKVWEDKHAAAAAKYEADMTEFKKTDAYKKYSKIIDKQKKKTSASKPPMKAAKKRKTDNGEEPQPEESPDQSPADEEEESPEEESPEEAEESPEDAE